MSSFCERPSADSRLTGRALSPDEKRFDRYDLTERLYIGLYRYESKDRGALQFFDVARDPPRNGIPSDGSLLSLDELLAEIKKLVDERNNTGIEWATLTEEIQGVDESEG